MTSAWKWAIAGLLVIVGGCSAIIATAPRMGESYTDVKVWGGVVSRVGECQQGKYSNECWVYMDGFEPVRREMSNWPGGTIQRGDRLGTNYRIGDEVVEVWSIRSTSNRMGFLYQCVKSSPDCYYPGKPIGEKQ